MEDRLGRALAAPSSFRESIAADPSSEVSDPRKEVVGLTNNLGRHILAEYYDCERGVLDDLEAVERYMKEAAVFSGATIVQSAFHRFNPHGVSGVVVISESHLAIHTWPEYGYAAVDLFTCGDAVDPWKAHDFLTRRFGAGRTDTREILRGLLEGVEGPIRHKPPATAAA